MDTHKPKYYRRHGLVGGAIRHAFLSRLLAAASLLVIPLLAATAQEVETFDTAANWVAGGTGLTTYGNHSYNAPDWSFASVSTIRNTTAAQDGFPGALGVYAWRLRNAAGSQLVATYTPSATLSAFGFEVRRWDGTPDPSYTVEYSSDGGATWESTGTTINNAFLENSSNWKSFAFVFPTPIVVGPGQFKVRVSHTTGERLLIDNFSWTVASLGPRIGVTGTFLPFSTFVGTPSVAQTVTVTGTSLTGDISVEAPVNFEVSADNIAFGSSVTLPQTGGAASGPIYLRVSSTASVGEQTGSVRLTSPDAAERLVAVSASVRPTLIPLPFGPDTFETTSFPWYSYTVAGTQIWARISASGNFFMQFNGFGSSVPSNAWLILGPFDIPAGATAITTSFNIEKGFNGPADELSLVVSSNYDGAGDPTLAAWQVIDFTKPADNAPFTPTGGISLPLTLSGQSGVFVAFRVISPGTGAAQTSRWRFDDFVLSVTGDPTAPSIAVDPASLTGLSATSGQSGAAQSFQVSGANLSGNLTVTAPTSFEVSTTSATTGFGSAATIPASGTLAATNVWVRIASTATVGSIGPSNVTVAGGGATTRNVAVSGTVTAPVGPTILPSTSSLSLSSTFVGTPSASSSFTVSGSNLTDNIAVSAPAGFEVSLSAASGFGNSVSITPVSGSVASTQIFVRLTGAAVGGQSGNVTLTSTGATTRNVAASGTVNALPIVTLSTTGPLPLGTVVQGTASAPQTFTVQGSNLTANLLITLPAGCEASSDSGVTWQSGTMMITPTGGSVPLTTISVRIAAAATPGSINSDVVVGTADIDNQSVAVTGNVTATATITPNPTTLAPMTTVVGSPSSPRNFSVVGNDLNSAVTVTAPAGFELSLVSAGTYSGSLTLSPVGGAIASTTIFVRLTGASLGSPAGNVSLSGGGAATKTVTVSGTVTPPAPTLTVNPSALSGFAANQGTASLPQTFELSGANLTADVTVTAPTNFEVSTDGGTSFAASRVLPGTGGTLTPTTVYVRISAAAASGAVSGNVSAATAGGTPQKYASQ